MCATVLVVTSASNGCLELQPDPIAAYTATFSLSDAVAVTSSACKSMDLVMD